MRLLTTFILFFIVNFGFSQAISYRYITPKKGHGQEFRKALGEKTKKYNSKEDEPRLYTFGIRASQNGAMMGVLRMSYGESLGELQGGANQPGMMDYWMKNVDVHIESTSSNEIFLRRKSATYNDAVGTDKPFRRVFHYNVKHGHQDKFWKIRDNLPAAIEKSGVDLDINSFMSFAGGTRQHARIVIFGEDMKSFEPGSGDWQKIRDAYNEINGEDSWEIDWELSNNSILEYGNSMELLEFLPELSSPIY
tara:strand:- start:439 stop:1188 length:750 start_codon:yes stop_codon:yes gene_type:complete